MTSAESTESEASPSATGHDSAIHPQPATPASSEQGPARSETTRRWLTAAVLVPLVLFVVFRGSYYYLGLAILVTVLGLSEFYRLIEDKGARPLVGLGTFLGVATLVVAYVGSEYHTNLMLAASLLGLMVAQLRKAKLGESLASVSGTFFGVFYVAWLLSHTILMRFFYHGASMAYGEEQLASVGLHPESGVFFIVFTLTVVVNCDAGAYFVGRAWGRRKLAPAVSPGKSVEGALGGIVVGTAMGALFKLGFDFFLPHMSAALPWHLVAPLGVVVAISGILGDLVESMLKRDAHVKDTGSLLPGMGGILDRIDAALLAVPIAYYLLTGYFYFTLRM